MITTDSSKDIPGNDRVSKTLKRHGYVTRRVSHDTTWYNMIRQKDPNKHAAAFHLSFGKIFPSWCGKLDRKQATYLKRTKSQIFWTINLSIESIISVSCPFISHSKTSFPEWFSLYPQKSLREDPRFLDHRCLSLRSPYFRKVREVKPCQIWYISTSHLTTHVFFSKQHKCGFQIDSYVVYDMIINHILVWIIFYISNSKNVSWASKNASNATRTSHAKLLPSLRKPCMIWLSQVVPLPGTPTRNTSEGLTMGGAWSAWKNRWLTTWDGSLS